jgi:hypothetical protein
VFPFHIVSSWYEFLAPPSAEKRLLAIAPHLFPLLLACTALVHDYLAGRKNGIFGDLLDLFGHV